MLKTLLVPLTTLVCLTFSNASVGDKQLPSGKTSKPISKKEVGDITGFYAIAHRGSDHYGVAIITKEEKSDVYLVRLVSGLYPKSVTRWSGEGIREGQTLAVRWIGHTLGVSLYRIEPGPRLVGRYTFIPDPSGANRHTILTETLIFLEPLEEAKE